MAVARLQFTEDATLTRGLYIIEPLAVVAYATVRARLHAF